MELRIQAYGSKIAAAGLTLSPRARPPQGVGEVGEIRWHHWPLGRLAAWPLGRLAAWPLGRLAAWPPGRLAAWPPGRVTRGQAGGALGRGGRAAEVARMAAVITRPRGQAGVAALRAAASRRADQRQRSTIVVV